MTIIWGRRTYTEKQFVDAWKSSSSIASVARALGLTIYGSTYSTLKNTAHELGLNSDHMTGQGWNVGGKFTPTKAKPVEEYLVSNGKKGGSHLKRRLIKEGLLETKCSAPYCPVPNPTINPFTGEKAELKLALDHINGDNTDNRIENLRLLCYHCHGMTDTWCVGSGIRARKKAIGDVRKICECGGPKGASSMRCRECEMKRRKGNLPPNCACGNSMSMRSAQCRICHNDSLKEAKINWPPLEELQQALAKSNYSAVGRQLGVSDNAVRKYIKRMSKE